MSVVSYCLHCQQKVTIEKILEKRETKHKRYLFIGVCPHCHKKVSAIRQEGMSPQGRMAL